MSDMYVYMYVCMYACMYQELQTNSSCVCTHLANKADSDSDSEMRRFSNYTSCFDKNLRPVSSVGAMTITLSFNLFKLMLEMCLSHNSLT